MQWIKPIDQEIADEELVPGHVPKQERFPHIQTAPGLSEHNEGSVSAHRVETALEYENNVSQPIAAPRSDRISLLEILEVVFRGECKIPLAEGRIGFGNEGALDDSEGRNDVGSVG